jgi:hypothetical protein
MRSHSAKKFLLYSFITFWLVTAPNGVVARADDQSKSKKSPPPYALIFGTLWDAQNRPIQGVRIKIRRDDQKKAKWELVSDRRGEFAQRVPAGKADYFIWADIKPKKGQKDFKPVETKAHIENDERIDIGLHLTE